MGHTAVIEKIADKHDLTPDQVDDLVEFVWHLVTRCMSDPKMPSVRLQGLGLFAVSPAKLKDLVEVVKKPDFSGRNAPNFKEFVEHVNDVYSRRIHELYHGNDNFVPKKIREDVKNMRNGICRTP